GAQTYAAARCRAHQIAGRPIGRQMQHAEVAAGVSAIIEAIEHVADRPLALDGEFALALDDGCGRALPDPTRNDLGGDGRRHPGRAPEGRDEAYALALGDGEEAHA